MKVDVIGNMCSWTEELSTSFIINDEILFDTPEGSFKRLFTHYDLEKINYVFITHFHSDHFIAIHLILDFFNKKNKKITIVAPKGCKERIGTLATLCEEEFLIPYLDSNVTFIECENGKRFQLGKYKVKCFKMEHSNVVAYGYTIDDGVCVGFSGDSCMCNSINKILKHSKYAFIDSGNIAINSSHLSAGEVLALQKEYTNCKIYPVHLYYTSKDFLNGQIELTTEGQTIILN